MKTVMPMLMRSSSSMNISRSCMKDTIILMNGVRNLKIWAIRLLDASAKSLDGVFGGSFASFGNYDECIYTTVYDKRRGNSQGKYLFQGKYCLIDFKMPVPPKKHSYKFTDVLDELKNFSSRETAISEAAKFAQMFYFLSLRLGVCVPSGCSLNDMQQIATALGDTIDLITEVKRCEIKEENKFTPLIISIIAVFSFLGFLMLCGTLIDLHAHFIGASYTNIGIQILLGFSFITNFKKFINTKTSSSNLLCLNGIRFLSMSWIILGHTYFFLNQQSLSMIRSDVYTFYRNVGGNFAFQIILNGTFSVDTFFFISGLLVCYGTIKYVKVLKKKFNISLYIVHRLWRIFPAYVAVIAFVFLMDLMGSGPMYKDFKDHIAHACYDNWWANLLFIHNFFYSKNMCYYQSWYVSCDIQFYLASLIVLLPLLRWPKVGIFLVLLSILTSVVYIGTITYLYDFLPAMLFTHPDPDNLEEFWTNIYFKPFAHISPYCIGLLSGYLLATRSALKIPKAVQFIGWCCAISGCMAVVYGTLEWNNGRDPNMMESVSYAIFNRTVWALGVAWLVICCATGYGGIINYILSWKIWIPLSRLTFLAYLVHPIIEVVTFGSIKSAISIQHFFPVWFFFGHLCTSYGTAFAGHMLVEAPFLAMERLLFRKTDVRKEDLSLKQKEDSNDLKQTEKNINTLIIPSTNDLKDEEANLGKKSFTYKL